VLSPKPWKLEAIMRLLLKLFICMCGGWILLAVLYSKAQPDHGRITLIALAIAGALCLSAALILLRKPWNAQNFLSRGLFALIVFYAGLVLTAWAQHTAGPVPARASVAQMVIAMLSLQGATLVLVTFFLKDQGTSWREAFGFSNDTRRAILIGLMVACLFLPIGSLLKLVSEKGIEHFTHTQAPQQEAVETIRVTSSPLHRILLGFVTIVLAPLGEETLFRGILYSTVRQAGFPKAAFWLSSIAFAAIHNNLAAFVPLLVLAMLLAVLYEKTDNLLAPITAHAAFNTFGFVYTVYKEAVERGFSHDHIVINGLTY